MLENTEEDALEKLHSFFTLPVQGDSILGLLEHKFSMPPVSDPMNILSDTPSRTLSELEDSFSSVDVPNAVEHVDDFIEALRKNVLEHAMPTTSPRFIGHMTSALPNFVIPLSKIMNALNQNVVKLETSKSFSPMERQVIGIIHKLAFGCADGFYEQYLHDSECSLGSFCSGGTTANITALWASRNRLLRPRGSFKGVHQSGLASGLVEYGYRGLAIFVSERGHYSLSKAVNILGIGQENLISIPTDGKQRINVKKLIAAVRKCEEQKLKPMAIIGIAGTTETGTIDPLNDLAQVAEDASCHFHVDAAWGGASLMSSRYRHKMQGIEKADSVVIDSHKQLYVPMGSGIVLFKDPKLSAYISHNAAYIIRKGSKDLGRFTLEGSRNGLTMLLYANLHILGRQGYEHLINLSIEKAKYFSSLIRSQEDFELITEPELCIFCYSYTPRRLGKLLTTLRRHPSFDKVLAAANNLIEHIQTTQKEKGRSFVSRTTIKVQDWNNEPKVVFRVVLANPLTTKDMLQDILEEQRKIAQESAALNNLTQVMDSLGLD